MSYVRVETSVPRHPKFLRAGPAASWLWLCGVAYCQDALTDGFIAKEALYTLGVQKPLPLVTTLVSIGLWHEEPNGWRVHDYLDHNNSAEYVRRVQDERRKAGRRGGRGRSSEGQNVKQFACVLLEVPNEQTASKDTNPATATAVQAATPTAVPDHEKQERETASPLPVENRERIDRLDAAIRRHRRQRSKETDNGRPAKRVITALARDVLQKHPDESDEFELRELLKEACVRANLHYDGQVVGTALEEARAQLRRSS